MKRCLDLKCLDYVEVVDIPKGGVMVYEMGNLALAFKHPGHTKE